MLHAVTTVEPPLPHEKRPETPLPLSYVIGRMLSKDREKRPATAREVVRAADHSCPEAGGGHRSKAANPAGNTAGHGGTAVASNPN